MSRLKSMTRRRAPISANAMGNLKNLREKLAANELNRKQRAAKPPLAPKGPTRKAPNGPVENSQLRSGTRSTVSKGWRGSVMTPAVMSRLGIKVKPVSPEAFHQMPMNERQIHIMQLLNKGYNVFELAQYYQVNLDEWI